jgi:ubiquinone/menaquinone biosynthesis C-methylase UbiE
MTQTQTQTPSLIGFGRWRRKLIGAIDERVLEVGCGWGHNFGHYGPAAQVTAFDVDLQRVKAAARRKQPVALALADAHQLPWPSAEFDAVVGTLVFCSIPEPARALAEIRRVLKPGGQLFLLEHVRSDRGWLGSTQDFLAPAWLRVTGGCNLNRDTEAAVRAAGFIIEQKQVAFQGVLKLMVAR